MRYWEYKIMIYDVHKSFKDAADESALISWLVTLIALHPKLWRINKYTNDQTLEACIDMLLYGSAMIEIDYEKVNQLIARDQLS